MRSLTLIGYGLLAVGMLLMHQQSPSIAMLVFSTAFFVFLYDLVDQIKK